MKLLTEVIPTALKEIVCLKVSQTDLRKAIIQERTWEFAAEGHSLFDMKRQHCMAERLGRAVDDKYYSLPLPQDETDKNPNLKQHPLW